MPGSLRVEELVPGPHGRGAPAPSNSWTLSAGVLWCTRAHGNPGTQTVATCLLTSGEPRARQLG